MVAYRVRDPEDITPLGRALSQDGILAVSDVYSVADLAAINAAMDPIFAQKAHEARSYVRPDEMFEAGIFDRVLSRRMKDLILSAVPDPVIYHLHAYEIAAHQTKSHIFSENLAGWHRDPDSEFFPGDPTHVSVFVYLTDVSGRDGAFEFSPHQPDRPLRGDSPVVSMTGPAGMSFIWHRSYYHRASPNCGSQRRRVLKVSVQPNFFPSVHLKNDFFTRLCAKVPQGDVETDLLLGRYQGRQAPERTPSRPLKFFHLQSRNSINLSGDTLAAMRRQEEASAGELVAYD